MTYNQKYEGHFGNSGSNNFVALISVKFSMSKSILLHMNWVSQGEIAYMANPQVL